MYFTTKTIALVAALLSTAAAAPAPGPAVNSSPNAPRDDNILVIPGYTDQDDSAPAIKQRSPQALVERGATDTFGDYTGQWTQYEDGSGTYLRTEDEHRYASGVKCWTDFFYISSYFKNTDWKRGGSIDCGNSQTCDLGIDQGVQTCNSWSIAVSAGAEFTLIKDVFSVSSSVTYTHGEQKCETVSTKSTCRWDDQGCHAIWSSQKVRVSQGYIRRRCDEQTGEENKTVWSKDWDLEDKAEELGLGCKASCADDSYPA